MQIPIGESSSLGVGLVERAAWYANHEFVPMLENTSIFGDHPTYKWTFLFTVASTQFAAYRLLARLGKPESTAAWKPIYDDLAAIHEAALRTFENCARKVFEYGAQDIEDVYTAYGSWLLELLYADNFTSRERKLAPTIGVLIVKVGEKLAP